MIVISKSDMDAILNSKIRKRTLELPVVKGEIQPARHPRTGRVLAAAKPPHGEHTKRCPLREHGMYTLVEYQPHGQYREMAVREPTRARSVLWWIAKCETAPRILKITVLTVERERNTWIVQFVPDKSGDVKDRIDDAPAYLAKDGGYTTTSVRQAVPGDPEVMFPFAKDLEEARRQAREGQATPQRKALDDLASEIETCAEVMSGVKRRERLRLALKEVERARAELSVEETATFSESVCAARQASTAVEGEPRPCGTKSDVSLQSAA